MTITLELTEEQERRVVEGAVRHDATTIREILSQALDAAVQKLLRRPPASADSDRFEALLGRLNKSFTAAPGHRPLPETTLTREGIYGDHP